MLQAPKQQIAAGDRAPNFVLPDHEGKFRMFYDQVTGRPLMMLFSGAAVARLPIRFGCPQNAAGRCCHTAPVRL